MKLKKDICTSQDKLVACQKELKSKISAIKAGQCKFEGTITGTLDIQLKGIMAVVQYQVQNLCEFSGELQVTQDIEPT
jgi:hypothetical protein